MKHARHQDRQHRSVDNVDGPHGYSLLSRAPIARAAARPIRTSTTTSVSANDRTKFPHRGTLRVPWPAGTTGNCDHHGEAVRHPFAAGDDEPDKSDMSPQIPGIDPATESERTTKATEIRQTRRQLITEIAYRLTANGRCPGAKLRRVDTPQLLTLPTPSPMYTNTFSIPPHASRLGTRLFATPVPRHVFDVPRPRSVPPGLAHPRADLGNRAHLGKPGLRTRIDDIIQTRSTTKQAGRCTAIVAATYAGHRHPSVPACLTTHVEFRLARLFAYSPQSRCDTADASQIIQLSDSCTWRGVGKHWNRL